MASNVERLRAFQKIGCGKPSRMSQGPRVKHSLTTSDCTLGYEASALDSVEYQTEIFKLS